MSLIVRFVLFFGTYDHKRELDFPQYSSRQPRTIRSPA